MEAAIPRAGCAWACGYLFNLAALHEGTPCHPSARQAPGESTPDFLARAMTEDHGFTVPGRSLFASEVVDGLKTGGREPGVR
jgi:hypothetical protein